MIAREFGIDPWSVIRGWTSLEVASALQWMELALDYPTVDQMYQMQTALEIRRKFEKNPGSYKLKDLQLPFAKARKEREMSPESRLAESKRFWMTLGKRFGGVYTPAPENCQ